MVGGLAVAYASGNYRLDRYRQIRPFGYGLIQCAFPVLSFVLVLATATIRTLSLSRRPVWPFVLKFIGVVTLAAALACFVFLDFKRPNTRSEDWFGTFIPHSTWMVLVAICIYSTWRSSASQLRAAWSQQSRSLEQPRTFEVTAAGVRIDENGSTRQYLWTTYEPFIETEHLLHLRPTLAALDAIPKRCFSDAQSPNAARHLMQTLIPNPEFKPKFPVIRAVNPNP